MSSEYSLTHLSDPDLLHELSALIARERATTAELLAHIAEVDARRLFRGAAYPSMFAYCVGELHLSEDAAYKHITAARAARRFPMLYDAIADGRLHLSAILLLAAHLTPESIEELVAEAAHQSKLAIEGLLAERFPRPDVLASIRVVPSGVTEPGPLGVMLSADPLAPGRVVPEERAPDRITPEELAPGRVEPGGAPAAAPAPGRVPPPWPAPRASASSRAHDQARHTRAKVWPLSSLRFALRVTIGEVTHAKLRYAQELLSHQSISGDVAAVLDRALTALIAQLEKRKFAETSRPREVAAPATGRGRYVPAEVRRAVWRRDGGRCTFVGESGRRCEARELLEFDHVDEIARGGLATVERMRLRCRAHNQLEAERTFGAEFMHDKREEARRRAAEKRIPASGAGVTSEPPSMIVCAP